MNILQVLYSGLGGHGNVAFSFIEGSEEQDNQKLIFYGIEPLKAEYRLRALNCKAEYESIQKRRGVDLKALKSYFKYLNTFKPEVIILHSTNLLLPTFLYKKFRGGKLLFVEHQSNQAKSKHEWLMTFLSFLLADKIVYLTEEYRKEIQVRINNFKKQKTVVIPNGINTNVFRAKVETFTEPAGVKLLMVSRLNKLRDHVTLLKAVAVLVKEHKLDKLQLTIAGEGDTLEGLKELGINLGIEKNLRFTGNLNEAEIVTEFQRADLYVHASLAETLSTSILQAMACRLPIIASDIPGINNLLSDNVNALLFQNSNYEELAKRILDLCNNTMLRNKMASSALAQVQANYSHLKMYQSYKEIYT